MAALTAGAVAIVAVLAAAAYLAGVRPGSGDSAEGAVAAVMAVPTSHAMTVLVKQRRQLIAMSAAAHTLSLVGKPALASRQPPSSPGAAQPGAAQPGAAQPGATGGGSSPSPAGPPAAPPSPGTAQSIAYHMLPEFGWSPQTYFSCLNNLWAHESGWLYNATNPTSGAYGIPQALPGSKMASAGPDWLTNPATQIRWGLGYIQSDYGNPCGAWAFWEGHGYY